MVRAYGTLAPGSVITSCMRTHLHTIFCNPYISRPSSLVLCGEEGTTPAQLDKPIYANLCRPRLSNSIRKAFPEIIAVQMPPNQDQLARSRNVLLWVRRRTVEDVEKLSYSLDNPLGPIAKEKPTLQPVEVECRPVGWHVTRKDIFPQHRPQPRVQRGLLGRRQFWERNGDG